MPINTKNPKYKKTVRLAVVISDTPTNQLLMSKLVEQSEHILQKAEGFAIIKSTSEELLFLANPNAPERPPEEEKS